MKQLRLCQIQKQLYYYNQGMVLLHMNLTTVFTLSYHFISLPAKYFITSLKQGLSLSSEWKHEHMKIKKILISFESDLHFWVQRFKSIMQKNAKKNTLISAFRWFALPHNFT